MRVFAAVLAMIVATGAAAQGAPKAPDKSTARPAAKSATARTAAPMPKPKPKSAAKPAKPAAKPAATETTKPPSANPGASKKGTASADPVKPSAIREAYAAMSATDRMALQSGLTWSGDYNGPIDGEFSDRLADAAKAYQKRRNIAATGILSTDDRAAIAAAASARQNAAGWRVVEDPVTGARVGIPEKFATKFTPGPIGARWSSEQGQLQIETFRIEAGTTLEATFAQQKKQPRRRITSSTLRPDSFVMAGTQGLKKLAVAGFARDGEVRGLTILYDQAMEGSIDSLVAPMMAAFVPFAGYTMAAAPSTTPRRDVEYGSGIVVSAAGHIVTDRALIDGCPIVVVPEHGRAERIADDPGSGLALLRAYGARGVTAASIADATLPNNVTLLGIADPRMQNGGGAVTTISAHLQPATGSRLLEGSITAGFAGAVATDAQGLMTGVLVRKAHQAVAVPADTVKRFLANQSVTPSARAGDAARASVVRVICVRK
jgi:peptidoglycan hydrolase-like protein with peptidoglycan-binding domain